MRESGEMRKKYETIKLHRQRGNKKNCSKITESISHKQLGRINVITHKEGCCVSLHEFLVRLSFSVCQINRAAGKKKCLQRDDDADSVRQTSFEAFGRV